MKMSRYRINSRFNSARARYTAAVWAAGPLPMITTLLCIPLVACVLTGLFCFWRVAVAARVIPAPPERKEKSPRRKAEENSLTVLIVSRDISLMQIQFTNSFERQLIKYTIKPEVFALVVNVLIS